MNVSDILKSWKLVIEGKNTALIESRLKICSTCPYRGEMNAAGKLLVQLTGAPDHLHFCKLCGCPLSSLLAREDATCKNNEW